MVQRTVANVSDAQGSPLAVAIEGSGHHVFGDEPVAQGGKNLGPTPYDLLTAALCECTAITIRWYAMRDGWPVEHVDVQVRHGKKLETGSNQMIVEFHKPISIVAEDRSETKRQKPIDDQKSVW